MVMPCYPHAQYTSPQTGAVLPAEGRYSRNWWEKKQYKEFHLTSSNWEHIALDRSSWKKSIKEVAARTASQEDKKAQPPPTNHHFLLPTLHQSMWIADQHLQTSEDPQVDDPMERTIILTLSDR